MGRGGARPGAGRKPKAETHETAIAGAEKRLADRLPVTIGTLEELADGGLQTVEEIYEPAGTIFVDATETVIDGKGNPRPVRVKVPAFPDLDPAEMVLVKRVVSHLAPDRAANIYLADRIMGKPKERHELSGEDGDAIPFAIVRVPAKAAIEEWQQNAQQFQNQRQSQSEAAVPEAALPAPSPATPPSGPLKAKAKK
jgi:hypothetical protein